jgi:hypothetical protein
MATISNTPRPGYVWDSTDNVWYPIGTGPHTHADYITSGSAINPNIVDAKGDIIAATAADTVARLAVGANDTVLTADSSTATGLKWAAVAGFSPSTSIVATNQNTTSTSYTNLATTQSVTLTTGTKALLFFSVGTYNTGNYRNQQVGVQVSGATSISPGTPNGGRYYAYAGGSGTGSYEETTLTKVIYYTGLTAGSNTFTLQFRTSGGDGYFFDRYLVVADMGS